MLRVNPLQKKICRKYSELVKMAQKYLAVYMRTHVRVTVVTNVNLALKHCFVHSVTCGSTTHTDHVIAYPVER
jgi:gamma-glutamyl phosphate reductase